MAALSLAGQEGLAKSSKTGLKLHKSRPHFQVQEWAGTIFATWQPSGRMTYQSFNSLATHTLTIPAKWLLRRAQSPPIIILSLESYCSSSICKCPCNHGCSGQLGVQQLLQCIQEIRKPFAILGQHTGLKVPGLSMSFMLVDITYLDADFASLFA